MLHLVIGSWSTFMVSISDYCSTLIHYRPHSQTLQSPRAFRSLHSGFAHQVRLACLSKSQTNLVHLSSYTSCKTRSMSWSHTQRSSWSRWWFNQILVYKFVCCLLGIATGFFAKEYACRSRASISRCHHENCNDIWTAMRYPKDWMCHAGTVPSKRHWEVPYFAIASK